MLNFKGWTKTAEDKSTTTLRHDKGHSMTLAHKKLPKIQQEMLKRLKLATGTDDGTVGDEHSDSKQPPNTNITVNAAPQPSSPMMPQSTQSTDVPVNLPPAVTAPNVLNSNGQPNPGNILKSQAIGQNQLSKIQQAEAQANIAPKEELLNNTAQQNKYFTDINNAVTGHADDLRASQGIRENAYLENMSAGRKMGTALGLILSGAGSGLSGQPNMAYDFLNKQIDRNIQAQKDRFGQANTVWGAYHDLYKDQVAADAATRAHQYDYASQKANLIALKSASPTIAANNMKLQSDLATERMKALREAATNVSALPGYGGNAGNSDNNTQQQGINPNQPSPTTTQQNHSKESIDSAYNSVGIDPSDPTRDKQLMAKGYNTNDVNEYARRLDMHNAAISNSTESNASQIPNEQAYKTYKILSSDAEKKLNLTQQGGKTAEENYKNVHDQWLKAQQSEKVLNGPMGNGVGGVHELMQNMYTNIGQGSHGLSGLASQARLSGEGGLSEIPYVGPGLAAASHIVPLTRSQEQYISSKNTLVTDIANALKDLVPPSEIDKIVNSNLPTWGDKPSDIKRKEQAIVNMVIKANTNGDLGRYKMLDIR